MDESRRNILKMFGIASASVVLPAVAEAATEGLRHQWVYNYTPPSAPAAYPTLWEHKEVRGWGGG